MPHTAPDVTILGPGTIGTGAIAPIVFGRLGDLFGVWSALMLVAVFVLFTLPIAIHKTMGSRAFTERIEGAGARLGLLGLFGSPVTVLAERMPGERGPAQQ